MNDENPTNVASGMTASGIMDQLVSDLGSLRIDIQKFFSTEKGEGQKIRDVYRKVSENVDAAEKKLPVRDVNYAIVIYRDDYYKGLSKFVREILSIPDRDSFIDRESEIRGNLNTAANNDKGFIESIFSDSRNPVNGTESVESALKSLESLIDFMDTLKEFENDVTELKSLISDSNNNEPTVIESCKLYAGSIKTFAENTIKCIYDIFMSIEKTVNSTNDEEEPAMESPFILL